ncbi:hypothetical protein EDEG_03717 [Edhazardia aedis USNM 41457]|uniref:Uncharacterized protein n=1 Tax=Edhazardia aedis (strain USNM 41457) TaxID=1003232 RepID=J9D1S2_EDHAE|nr:hypothetical protein EDEG_03717 [Edhazardia aedis USNM 41457]|eukprot:EJW01796.1 hypothetical protein EDEG_03717 [Edhazardia aedis USNM 41457]
MSNIQSLKKIISLEKKNGKNRYTHYEESRDVIIVSPPRVIADNNFHCNYTTSNSNISKDHVTTSNTYIDPRVDQLMKKIKNRRRRSILRKNIFKHLEKQESDHKETNTKPNNNDKIQDTYEKNVNSNRFLKNVEVNNYTRNVNINQINTGSTADFQCKSDERIHGNDNDNISTIKSQKNHKSISNVDTHNNVDLGSTNNNRRFAYNTHKNSIEQRTRELESMQKRKKELSNINKAVGTPPRKTSTYPNYGFNTHYRKFKLIRRENVFAPLSNPCFWENNMKTPPSDFFMNFKNNDNTDFSNQTMLRRENIDKWNDSYEKVAGIPDKEYHINTKERKTICEDVQNNVDDGNAKYNNDNRDFCYNAKNWFEDKLNQEYQYNNLESRQQNNIRIVRGDRKNEAIIDPNQKEDDFRNLQFEIIGLDGVAFEYTDEQKNNYTNRYKNYNIDQNNSLESHATPYELSIYNENIANNTSLSLQNNETQSSKYKNQNLSVLDSCQDRLEYLSRKNDNISYSDSRLFQSKIYLQSKYKKEESIENRDKNSDQYLNEEYDKSEESEYSDETADSDNTLQLHSENMEFYCYCDRKKPLLYKHDHNIPCESTDNAHLRNSIIRHIRKSSLGYNIILGIIDILKNTKKRTKKYINSVVYKVYRKMVIDEINKIKDELPITKNITPFSWSEYIKVKITQCSRKNVLSVEIVHDKIKERLVDYFECKDFEFKSINENMFLNNVNNDEYYESDDGEKTSGKILTRQSYFVMNYTFKNISDPFPDEYSDQ